MREICFKAFCKSYVAELRFLVSPSICVVIWIFGDDEELEFGFLVMVRSLGLEFS